MVGTKKPFILVTGTACSGTRFIHFVFRAAKIPMKHESGKLSTGLSSWHCGAVDGNIYYTRKYDGTLYRIPDERAHTCEDIPKENGIVILHQTRHPLKTISTCQRLMQISWEYIYRVTKWKINSKQPLLLRCMLYWHLWNQMIEKRADYQYRIENIYNEWDNICNVINRPEFSLRLDKIKRIDKSNTKINHSRPNMYKPRTWRDLRKQDAQLTKKIIEQGRKYGYDI